jgi:hypothetical protein
MRDTTADPRRDLGRAAHALGGAEIGQHARINARMVHGGHPPARAFREMLRPGARAVVQVPIKGFRQKQALGLVEPQRVHVREEHQEPGEALLFILPDAELRRVFDRAATRSTRLERSITLHIHDRCGAVRGRGRSR